MAQCYAPARAEIAPATEAGAAQIAGSEAAEVGERERIAERNAKVEANLGLVGHAIQQMHLTRRNDVDDCFQVGVIGLMRAVEDYDPGRGVVFSTYAVNTIKGHLLRHVRGADLIRLPGSVVGEARAELRERLTCRALPGDLGDLLADPGAADSADLAELADDEANVPAAVAELLSHLPARWGEVVRRRTRGDTLDQIAADFGVSRARVGQVETRAMMRLRELARLGLVRRTA